MGVGVMVAANRLIPITDHRPATLQMQGHLASLKPKRIEIAPGLLNHQLGQHLKGLLLMQLPHPMQISRPGTTLAGVALGLAAKLQQSLHAGRLPQRVERKLRRCHDGREELMKLKRAHTPKPLRFTVNTAQKSRPRRTGIRLINRATDQQKWLTNSGRTACNVQDLLSNRSLAGLVVVKGEGLGQLLGVIAGVVHSRHPASQL